jgi:hypothetical protein
MNHPSRFRGLRTLVIISSMALGTLVLYELLYFGLAISCVTAPGVSCIYFLTMPQIPGIPG